MTSATERTYPGARRPDRRRRVDAAGVGLAVSEWGDPDAPPILLAHGGFDFAGTFDCFAPRLADAGWRVVSWDHRGHGDSDHVALYQWSADVRDAVAVLDSIGPDPIPFVGHSKGGTLLLELAETLPHRVSTFVNLDGVPSRGTMTDVQDHDRTKLLASEIGGWLAHRRRIATAERKPGTIEELAARRARMNPRLDRAWLEYLVTIGARQDADGWRWKIDPALRFGGFGPWRPEWSLQRVSSIGVPLLIVLATELEEMGWQTTAADLTPVLPATGRVIELAGVGHFVHIEQPDLVAELVLDHLAGSAR